MSRPQEKRSCLALTPAGRDTVWRHWDDIYVIYQRASGETHAFNETTAEILRCLAGGAMDLRGLIERVAAVFETDPDGFSEPDFQAVTERLVHLGLVERRNRPDAGS